MPPLEAIRPQWLGLWRMAKGDARGLSVFDISDEGVIRSFWAIVYCLPAFLIHAILLRVEYLGMTGDPTRGHFIFLFQSLVLQLASWVFLLMALLLFGFAFGYRPLLRPMVVMLNWGSIPPAYAVFGLLYPLLLLTDGSSTAIWLLHMGMLLAAMLVLGLLVWRILYTFLGGHWFRRLGFTALVCLSSFWATHALETSMRLAIP